MRVRVRGWGWAKPVRYDYEIISFLLSEIPCGYNHANYES